MADIKTNAGGQYIETPAGGSWADALGALATSFAAKRKYEMDNQNAFRNSIAPTLLSGTSMQPPAGATLQDLMGQMNNLSGQPGLGSMGMGQPQAPNARPWVIGQNPKLAQDAALNKATIAEKGQNVLQSKEAVKKSEYDRSGSAAVQKAALGASDEYAKTASLGLDLPGAMPWGQSMSTAAMNMTDVLKLINTQNQANAPTQEMQGTMSRSKVLAELKRMNKPATKANYDIAVQKLRSMGIAVVDEEELNA